MTEELQEILMAINNNLHRIALSTEKLIDMVNLEKEERGSWEPTAHEYGRDNQDD